MDSQFFKYSRRANPLILLFLGILGVIWGSTTILGILLFATIAFAVADTSLQNDIAALLGVNYTKKQSASIAGSSIKSVIFGYILFILFGFIGLGFIGLCGAYFTIKYLYFLRRELKIALLKAPKLP